MIFHFQYNCSFTLEGSSGTNLKIEFLLDYHIVFLYMIQGLLRGLARDQRLVIRDRLNGQLKQFHLFPFQFMMAFFKNNKKKIFGYVDSQAKIFLIFYNPFENSTARTAILSPTTLCSSALLGGVIFVRINISSVSTPIQSGKKIDLQH